MIKDQSVFDEESRMDIMEREAAITQERDDAIMKASFLQDSLDEVRTLITCAKRSCC